MESLCESSRMKFNTKNKKLKKMTIIEIRKENTELKASSIKPPVTPPSRKAQNNYFQLRPVLFVRFIQLIVAVHFAWELL